MQRPRRLTAAKLPSVLSCMTGKSVTLDKSAIEEMRVIPQSLMPEGLLDGLGDQQIRDLFAFLRISQPLPLASWILIGAIT